MRQKTSHFLIGLFVITGALLIVLGVIVLGATAGLRQSVLIETCFDESVQGLENGSPMRLRGVKIGEVQEITFANRIYPTQHTYALVRVAVATRSLGAEDVSRARRAVQELITQGMRVRLAPQGITGNLYLESEMKARHDDELKIDWKPALPYVPSTPSLLGRVTSSVDTVLERLARTDFDGLIAEGRDALKALAATAEGLQVARQVLEPLQDRLPATVKRLDATLQEVQDFAQDAREAARSLQSLLARADQALAGLEQSAGGGGRDLEAVLANLRTTTEQLRAFSESLREQPGQLLFGQPPRPILERR